MAAAVRKQVLDEILRVMQNDLAFNVQDSDSCRAIEPKNIRFRKVSVADRDINKGKVLEGLPGIFVSCPLNEPFGPGLGTNEEDEYRWGFLAQIVDKDHFDQTSNAGTYFQWQEQLCQKFQFHPLDNVDSVHAFTNAMSVDVVDEKYWLKEEAFKAGVLILARVWMTRL